MASKRGTIGRVALLLVGGGVSVALLFWAKLRVVTNIPRTTYAEPSGEGVMADGASERADPEDGAKPGAEPGAEPGERAEVGEGALSGG